MKLNLSNAQITDEDRIFFRSVEDKIDLAEKHFSPKFTFFLDERVIALTERVFADSHYNDYYLYGGYDSAVRKILAVAPPYSYANSPEFPIKALTISYRKNDELTHRDVLGSLMALDIKRKTVGDILCGSGKTVVFVVDTVAETVLQDLKKVGKIGVKVTEGADVLPQTKQDMITVEKTVASLRLDCIISAALGLSRERSATLIKNGLVTVEHLIRTAPDFEPPEGCTFSARGYGKFVFASANGVSKKNRIHITIKKFV